MDLQAFWVWLTTDDDAPAWIQAIGSVAGIAIAILVPAVLELRRRHEQQIARRNEAVEITEAAIDIVREVVRTFDDAIRIAQMPGERLGHERFDVALKIVDRFPHDRLADHRVRRALLDAELALVFFRPRYETYLDRRKSAVARSNAFSKMDQCRKDAAAALDLVRLCLAELRPSRK